MQQCTTCFSNVAVGDDSLQHNVFGAFNVAVGDAALLNFTGYYATALGYQTLRGATSTGAYSVAVGFNAISGASYAGNYDTGVGAQALSAQTTGYYNTALGANAGNTITTGASNTCLGEGACNGITTGSNNIVIGYSTLSLSPNLTNAIIITSNNISQLDFGYTNADAWTFAAPIITPSFPYTRLPSCTSAIKGARLMITDGAATPTFTGMVAGGGTLMTPVYCDGTSWRNG